MGSTGTTLVGSLSETGAAEVLRLLAGSRRSGLLRLGTSSPSWVALSDGSIVLAGSNNGPGLRQVLNARATLQPDVLGPVAERHGHHDLTLLSALVEVTDDGTLYPVVREQVVGTVFQALLPSGEQFAFLPGDRLPLAEHFSFQTETILDEAERRVAEWAEIAESIPSTQVVFRHRRRLNRELSSVTLTRDEWSVLAVLDGRRSVAQTIAAVGISAFEVCAVLHRLLRNGLIERTG